MKKKTIWAALLCAAVGFTGMLAGCSGNKQDTLDFEGVSELNLSMTMTASYVEVITNADDVGRVTDVLETGSADVYEIAHGRLLVPALKRVLREVDTAGGRIVFDAAVLREVGLFED